MRRSTRYRFPWISGLLIGCLSFLGGVFLTHHFITLGEVPEFPLETANTTVAGWYYYNAHNVPLSQSIEMFGNSATQPGTDLISNTSSDYISFLWALPPLALVPGGILASARHGTTRTASYAMMNGAMIAIGYGAAAIAGLLVFQASEGSIMGSASMYPDPMATFLYMVIIYPVVIGGFAGLLFFFAQGNLSIRVSG